MNCTEFQNELLDYLYGELTPKQEALSHLQVCSSCQGQWAEWAKTREVYSQLPSMAPTQGTLRKITVYARRHSPHRSTESFREKIARFFESFRLVGVRSLPASVMALVVLAVIFVFASPVPQEKVAVTDKMILTNDSALRNRLLENPFKLSSPSFDLVSRPGNDSAFRLSGGDHSTFVDSEIPQAGQSLADLEKKWEERRRMLLESDADALMMRGRRLKAMGRIDLALNDFETIYRFYPDYTYLGDVLMYRAQCYAFQGNYDKALESLGVFAQKYPAKKPLIQSMIDQLEAEKEK